MNAIITASNAILITIDVDVDAIMFKFDFDIEADEEEEQHTGILSTLTSTNSVPVDVPVDAHAPEKTFSELSLAELLEALPAKISYSPLVIPLSSGRKLTLPRRDLFDARFQLIDEDDGRSERQDLSSALVFLSSPSDLVPGVYEGGLKTWECSLDLVEYLHSIKDTIKLDRSNVRGGRVLEIGCGTAVSSLFLLHEIFSNDDHTDTHIHLQDYNDSVLKLVTVPNILLTWYFSPAGELHRTPENATDIATASEVHITDALLASFQDWLHSHRVHLRFFCGSWAHFATHLHESGETYNLVLTSETVYRTESLPSLVLLMQRACGVRTLSNDRPREYEYEQEPESSCLCLVAAKVVYFGVGGGIAEFVKCVEDPGYLRGGEGTAGSVAAVWENVAGVGRKILRVCWHPQANEIK